MSTEITLYGPLKRLVGARTLHLADPAATPGALKQQLAASHPALAPHLAACVISAGDQLLRDDAAIPADAPLALLPPVSGG